MKVQFWRDSLRPCVRRESSTLRHDQARSSMYRSDRQGSLRPLLFPRIFPWRGLGPPLIAQSSPRPRFIGASGWKVSTSERPRMVESTSTCTPSSV